MECIYCPFYQPHDSDRNGKKSAEVWFYIRYKPYQHHLVLFGLCFFLILVNSQDLSYFCNEKGYLTKLYLAVCKNKLVFYDHNMYIQGREMQIDVILVRTSKLFPWFLRTHWQPSCMPKTTMVHS